MNLYTLATKKSVFPLAAVLCCTSLFVALDADARPKNKIHVTPEHDKHDLRRYSPDFDIKLKCNSVRWVIDEPTQWDARFDIKDHNWGGIDKELLTDLTHNSVTQRPVEKSSIYVSNVKNVKKGFNLEAQCADDVKHDNDDD